MKDLKKFTEFLTEEDGLTSVEKFGELVDRRNFNPNDPEVRIRAHGVKKLKEIKRFIESALESLLKDARKGKLESVEHAMKEAHSLHTHVKAYNEASRELELPEIKERRDELLKFKEEKKKLKKNVDVDDEDDEVEIDEARSKKIEHFIKTNKKSFKKQYGKDWERILYAMANKMSKKK